MVESPIPQDILKYKGKFIGNLSTRETICGALGVSFAMIGYFVWFNGFSDDVRMTLSAFVALPFFLVGFLKIYDQPFEKIAPTLIKENFIYPTKRRKEVHFPAFERYEKTRYWMLTADMYEEEGDTDPTEDTDSSMEAAGVVPKVRKTVGKKNRKKKSPRVTIKRSMTYKGMK